MGLKKSLDYCIYLVQESKLDLAISRLNELLVKHPRKDDIISLSRRLNQLNQKVLRGIIDSEETNITKNKIGDEILKLIRSIESEVEQTPHPGPFLLNKKSEHPIKEKEPPATINVGNIKQWGIMNFVKNTAANKVIHHYIGFKALFFSLGIIAVLLLGFYNRGSITQYVKNQRFQFDSKDTTHLKILLVPLTSDIDNLKLDVDYESQLVEYFNQKKEDEHFKIKLAFLKGFTVLTTKEEISKLGEAKNADLVIWGSFEEGPDHDVLQKVRLQYLLTNDFQVDRSKIKGDTEMQRLEDLKQLRTGELQPDIDYVVYWIKGMEAYEKGNFKIASRHFEKILKNFIEYEDLETYWRLCQLHLDFGKYNEAVEYGGKAMEICETTPDKDPLKLAVSYDYLGVGYRRLGSSQESLVFHKKSIAIREKKLAPNHRDLLASYNNIAITYMDLGEYKEALKYQHKIIPIQEKTLGPKHPEVALAYDNIASSYLKIGDNDQAIGYYEKAINIREEILKPKHKDLAQSYNNISVPYQKQERYEIAIHFIEKAIAIREEILGGRHPDLVISRINLAQIYQKIGNLEEALMIQLECMDILEQTPDANHADLAGLYNNIAETYRLQKEYDSTMKFQKKAIRVMEHIHGKEHPDVATFYSNLALTYHALEEYDKALAYQLKVLKIREKKLNPDSDELGSIYFLLGRSYFFLGEYTNALEFQEKSAQVFGGKLASDHPIMLSIYKKIALTCDQLGLKDKAMAFRKKIPESKIPI